jgi:hypothetical protein
VSRDPALPTAALAVDPHEARRQIRKHLGRLTPGAGDATLRAIRVIRHKPGKRCLVEYDVDLPRPGRAESRFTLIGKIRHRRYGNAGYRLLSAFWNAGFDDESPDGISVPRPVATLSAFRMWLQQKVPGVPATALLPGPEGIALARRIAEAAHKIHRAGVPAETAHTVADEMLILRECLAAASEALPALAARIDAVLAGCERVAASLPAARPTGIHRDFYADQVLVVGDRIYVVDFDLYCTGDTALDVGNFAGHLIEQSVRACGRPDAFADREAALVERFVELEGRALRPAIDAYTTLTLARHVYLSTRFAERQPFTEAILAVCEERLSDPR